MPLVFIKVRPAAVTKWHRKLITTSSGRCHRDRLMKPNKAPVKASVFNYSLLIAFRLLACGEGALFQCNCSILRMIHYLFCCIISRLADPLGEEKTITGSWALFYSVNLVTSLFWPCFWFFFGGWELVFGEKTYERLTHRKWYWSAPLINIEFIELVVVVLSYGSNVLSFERSFA